MGRGKPFECEVTVSASVEEKLAAKHGIEIWEIEEIIYDDPTAFSLRHGDCYFVYGQTSAGRYLLSLVRVLEKEEVRKLGFTGATNLIKVITAREMNQRQRHLYMTRRGDK
ncbi:MAG: hypothetical protein AB1512_12600 [Thermodesulfobacteriota bacterium]